MKQTIVAGVLCLALLLTACSNPITAVSAAAPLVPSQAEQSEPASSEPAPAPNSEPEPVAPPIVENQNDAPPEPAQPPAKAEPTAPPSRQSWICFIAGTPPTTPTTPLRTRANRKSCLRFCKGLK